MNTSQLTNLGGNKLNYNFYVKFLLPFVSRSMIPIKEKDGDKLHYKIDGLLEPDTEYVFRIRAVYPDGPGVYSDACITKTLPEGLLF